MNGNPTNDFAPLANRAKASAATQRPGSVCGNEGWCFCGSHALALSGGSGSAFSVSVCRASSGELQTEARKAAAASDYVDYGMETERRDEGMLGQLHNLQK